MMIAVAVFEKDVLRFICGYALQSGRILLQEEVLL